VIEDRKATMATQNRPDRIVIDLNRLNELNDLGCPACNRKFELGETVVAACGDWQGGPRLVHASEAVFDQKTGTYVERRCYLASRNLS
jgi:hypothetical protein